ncbi:flagellar assembly protein FliH [bacterium]|nr:flagellar assembly protein FliH [bacterium]
MQKWCPEPFDFPVPTATMPAPPAAFEAAGPRHSLLTGSQTAERFRKETGFSTPEALMTHLTADERATVFELVEIDVAAEYQKREEVLREEFARREQEIQAEFRNWGESFAREVEVELQATAKASVDLACDLAERIVRTAVSLDREILARVIENTLFKIQSGHPLEVTANPEDAAWLEGDPVLRERLRIGKVVPDRRMERGGCRIQCEGREWDASLKGQLDSLTDMVREMIAAPVDIPGSSPTETDEDHAGPVE